MFLMTATEFWRKPESLDSTFGQGGIVETAINSLGDDNLSSTAIQSDGKIIAAGDIYDGSYHSLAVSRYNTDGSLDYTFGTNGIAITNIGTPAAINYYLAIQSDGKIVVAGSMYNGSDYDFLVLRFKSNGALDIAFGNNGITTTHIGSSNDIVSSVSIQSDGKIVVAGDYNSGGNNYDFAAVRFTTDGNLDNTFGTNGIVKTPIGSSNDFAESAAIQTDGKIVLAGYTNNGSAYDFAIVRYNTNGDLDNTFGTGGITTTTIGPVNSYARAVKIQDDGKIVVSGYFIDGIDYSFVTARYNSDGDLDNTFGGYGIVATPIIGSSVTIAYSMSLESDGKIITAGYSMLNSFAIFTIVRYSQDGILDSTFGANGKVISSVGQGSDIITSTSIQSDGKIIAAGSSENGSYEDFALARYDQNGDLDDTFGDSGIVTTSITTSTSTIKSLALQGDNKIVAAGYTELAGSSDNNFSLARYDEKGNLDKTFGTNGIVSTTVDSDGGQALSVVIQNDGKILAGGYSNDGSYFNYTLVRYNSDGSLDNTFGTNGGIIISSIGGASDSYLNSLALQQDGKIVAAGYSTFSGKNGFTVVRYLSNGTKDYTFGTSGYTSILLNYDLVGEQNDDRAQSVLIQDDGKILVGGYTFIGGGYAYAVVRFDSSGSIDSTFGNDGIVNTQIGNPNEYYEIDHAYSMALQSDGKIILAGSSYNGSNYDFALVRYKTNGDLDDTFGSNGIVIIPIGVGNDQCYSVKIQSDGKIIAVGKTAVNGSNDDIALVRLNSDGTLDDTFGTGGKINTNIGISDNQANEVIIQGDRIVTGGSSNSTTSQYGVFSLVGYLNDDVVPVELVTFKASLNDNHVNLNWTTATGINNLGYEIQRSQSSKIKDQNKSAGTEGWEKIGFVNGHGNSTNTNSYHFIDSKINDGVYYYRLKQIDLNGSFTYSNTVKANINAPIKFSLEQNYPNPFNPTTKIRYSIHSSPLPFGKGQGVRLEVYDMLGRDVATLIHKKQQPGNYEVTFDASKLSSGVYFYKLTSGSFVETKKMIFLK